MSFLDYLQKRPLASATDDQLSAEMELRKHDNNPFPIHLFPARLKPYIDVLVGVQDCAPAFIGGSMLAVLSVAIGSYYKIAPTTTWSMGLPIWMCNLGISSGGKSMTEGFVVKPLYHIHAQMERDNDRADRNSENSEEEVKDRPRKLEVIIQNTTFEPMLRETIFDNPKGLLKHEDELTSWLDGMKAYSKTDIERKFWLSAWNLRPYKMRRSSNKSVFVERPYCSVVGGTQPRYLARFFSDDLLGDGFTVRMLFNVLDRNDIANADILTPISKEVIDLWDNLVKELFYDLEVRFNSEPHVITVPLSALHIYVDWEKKKREAINALTEISIVPKDIMAMAFGKIKEYAFRFSAILAVLDAYEHKRHGMVEAVEDKHIRAGLQIADYYLVSFQKAYLMSSAKLFVPIDVLDLARMFKSGATKREMAKKLGVPLTTLVRKLEKNMREYPHAFGANVK